MSFKTEQSDMTLTASASLHDIEEAIHRQLCKMNVEDGGGWSISLEGDSVTFTRGSESREMRLRLCAAMYRGTARVTVECVED